MIRAIAIAALCLSLTGCFRMWAFYFDDLIGCDKPLKPANEKIDDGRRQ